MELPGCRACRHGEVKARDRSLREKPGEVPQSGFRLARPGFGFKDYQPRLRVHIPDCGLRRIGRGKSGQLLKTWSGPGGQLTQIDTDRFQCR